MNRFGKSPTYPSLSDFLNSGGKLEIGYIHQMDVAAIGVIEGNVVWEGKPSYASLDELLADADRALRDFQDWGSEMQRSASQVRPQMVAGYSSSQFKARRVNRPGYPSGSTRAPTCAIVAALKNDEQYPEACVKELRELSAPRFTCWPVLTEARGCFEPPRRLRELHVCDGTTVQNNQAPHKDAAEYARGR